ncbi:lasso RiPP family leader peptide-containing protein [Nonomuraea sp. MG754425]|nr:lasso RiPP family leader peptide-containing protein [Nonomuraea sp. MG754425]
MGSWSREGKLTYQKGDMTMVHDERAPMSYEPPAMIEVGEFGEVTHGSGGWFYPDFFDYFGWA